MLQRFIVVLLYAPFILLPLYLGNMWSFGLFLVIALIAGHEFFELMTRRGLQPASRLGLFWIALLVANSNWPQMLPLEPLLIALLLSTLVYAMFQHQQSIESWLSTAVGALYLGLLINQMFALRMQNDGLWWLTLALLITWINDTVAYIVGVNFGRRRIWVRLSPRKSWEGTVGGWVGAALIGAVIAYYSPLPLTMWAGALLGFCGGILALLGDLSISMIKRQTGVKDTGHLIPGHGGMLDRLDSVLFVVPLMYQVVRFMDKF